MLVVKSDSVNWDFFSTSRKTSFFCIVQMRTKLHYWNVQFRVWKETLFFWAKKKSCQREHLISFDLLLPLSSISFQVCECCDFNFLSAEMWSLVPQRFWCKLYLKENHGAVKEFRVKKTHPGSAFFMLKFKHFIFWVSSLFASTK